VACPGSVGPSVSPGVVVVAVVAIHKCVNGVSRYLLETISLEIKPMSNRNYCVPSTGVCVGDSVGAFDGPCVGPSVGP